MNSPRPPVVAVMGHIDHGKSSLLDAIRKTNIVASEAGGITQHISAYEVEIEHEGKKKKITFLDTPGHEAFKATRAKGATAADIAILVVAADEGVKPQTLEALSAIKEAGTPFIVALTKIDKQNVDIHRAQGSLLEHEIYLEGMGGDIAYAGVSAKTGEGIDKLLELIVLTAELHELSGDASLPATGIVIESDRDPRQGNGATLIIKDGTLKTGSFVVAGSAYAPVRFIESWSGTRIEEAPPSTPVRIVGFSDLPETGSTITVVKNKKEAEETVATLAKETEREQFEGSTTGAVLPLIIKADAAGSVDAIKYELRKVSHPHIALKIIGSGVGQISEGDVKMAIAAGNGLIVGFHTKPEKSAADLADRSDIEIKTFTIIYELTECVDEALKARAPKVQTEEVLGRAKVLRTFSTMGTKQVIGARVIEGVFLLGRSIKIERRGVDLGKGKILNLQVQRVDKENVPVETEFGAQVDSRTEIAVGDELICYHIVTT